MKQLLVERAKQYSEGGKYKDVFEGKDVSIKDNVTLLLIWLTTYKIK